MTSVPNHQQQLSGSRGVGKKRTLLLVEEKSDWKVKLSRFLRKTDYELFPSHRKREIFQMVKSGEAGLLLLDQSWALKDKFSLSRSIRKIFPSFPTLFLLPIESSSLLPPIEGRPQFFEYFPKNGCRKDFLKIIEYLLKKPKEEAEREKIVAELERKLKELSISNKISKTLNTTLKLKEVLNIIMNEIMELVKAEAWSILLLDEKTGELVFEAAAGEKGKQIEGFRLKKGVGIAGRVAETGKGCIVPEVRKDPQFYKTIDKMTGFHTRSILAIPLSFRGKILGVVEIINKLESKPFTEKDLELVSSLADQASIAIENARLYEEVERLAITDDLTQLYNSRYCNLFLEEAIKEAEKNRECLSIIFFDLDSLKDIDDRYGHLMGGEALKEAAERIRDILGKEGMAARYGGDEFVVVLPKQDKFKAYQMAERIRKAIEDPHFLIAQGISHQLTTSLGIASYPEHARIREELLRKADQAMYRVKGAGKNQTAIAER